MPFIPLNGQSYESRSVEVSAQRTVNWYPELDTSGDNNLVFYPTPGYDIAGAFTRLTPNNQPVRGMAQITVNSFYVVASSTLYKFQYSGGWSVTTYTGSLSTTTGHVNILVGYNSVLVLDGLYAYTLVGTTVTRVDTIDADVPNAATTGCVIDGYYVVNNPATNSNYFNISGIYDPTSWSALDYDVADRSPDAIVAIRNVNGQLWLIGENTTEVWYDSGNPLFPFERVNGAILERGTVSERSVVVVDNSVIMVARAAHGGAEVVRSNGYQYVKISTPAIDYQLQKGNYFSNISNCYAFVMQYYGHTWYVLTGDNITYVYDLELGMWFEWAYTTDNICPIGYYVFCDNKHFMAANAVVPGSERPYIVALERTKYYHNTSPITRLRRSPHFRMGEKSVFCNAVHLKFEQGTGNEFLTSYQIMLRWSDDGGHTWSSEQWRSIPGFALGVYNKPIVWRRLGRFYTRMFEIKVTDPVNAVMYSAYMDADTGIDEVRK